MFKPERLEKLLLGDFEEKAKKYRVGQLLKVRGNWLKDKKAYLLILNFRNSKFVCALVLPKAKEVHIFKREKLLKADLGGVVLETLTPLKSQIADPAETKPFFDRWVQIKKKLEVVAPQTVMVKDNIFSGLLLALTKPEGKYAKNLAKEIKKADDVYYGGKGNTGLTDEEYDAKMEQLEFLDSDNQLGVTKTGTTYVEEDSRDKVPLPFQIGSQTPVKPGTGQLEQWKKSTGGAKLFVVSSKQDGVNCLAIYKSGKLTQAFTKSRGGLEGREITAKVRQIPGLPTTIRYTKELTVNMELEMEDQVFAKKYEGQGFKNPRNFISGILNRKKLDPRILSDVKAYAFTVLEPKGLDKDKQFKLLERLKFPVVDYQLMAIRDIKDDTLTQILKEKKSKSKSAMDGLVVEVNDNATRKRMEDSRDSSGINPEFSRKFKLGDEEDQVIVPVKKVLWSVSKQGYLKPRVMLTKPLRLQGVDITYASGFNAKFIIENKIGPKAKIKITRSGDVIPHILEITKPSKADIPKFCPSSGDIVKLKGVELYCPNEECPGRLTKQNISFFRHMDIEFLSSKTVQKFEQYGYDTVDKILNMTVKDMESLEGIQHKMAVKLYDSVHATLTKGPQGKGIELPQLMDASGFFQTMGSTRLGWVYKEYKGNVFTAWEGYTKKELITELTENIHGIGSEVATVFAYGIGPFKKWFKKNQNHFVVQPFQKKVVKSKALNGQYIAFTGFRNKSWEQAIEMNGGHYQNNVNKDTTILVLKDFKGSSKERKAQSLGAKLMLISEFDRFLTKRLK